MKKILLSLFLVLCLLMSVLMVACDSGKDNEEKDKTTGAKDDPDKNIAKLVATINEGVDFESLMNDAANTEELSAELDKAMNQLKTVAYQAAITATIEGDTESLYIGMKDGSCAATIGDVTAYSFIEDDWKIVTVSGYDGEYEGEVMSELADAVEMMLNPVDIEDAFAPQGPTVATTIMSIKLPEIAKSNIKYEDGKYIFDNDYLLSIANTAVDELWNMFVEQDPELAEDEAQLQEAKDMIASYMEKIDLAIYCYMKNEAFTGIGVDVELDPEFASEMMGYDTVKALVEINNEFINVDVNVANGDEIVMKSKVNMTYAFDKDGIPTAATLKVDLSAPYSDYEYDEVYNEEWDEYYTEEACRIEGLVTVKADLTFDLSKSENGEFFKVDASVTRGAGKAYVWNEETYEYEYDAELTGEYGSEAETLTFVANATAKNGKDYTLDGVLEGVMDGEYGKLVVDLDVTADENTVDGTFVATMTTDDYSESVNVTVGADINSAPDFPAVPAAVQQARQEALEEYNMYN